MEANLKKVFNKLLTEMETIRKEYYKYRDNPSKKDFDAIWHERMWGNYEGLHTALKIVKDFSKKEENK